ncbi:hypothetical protein CHS0354_014059 [Potamilus streckersoni]|uniref:Uncharacterized protein n=1 Tax=Potamilus streckersoni TaxID=2493646 RepID=A0AAE0SV09_9BIVA|nr:hypothetical protein CHS0354_014059 [Potamilus streckersoni]
MKVRQMTIAKIFFTSTCILTVILTGTTSSSEGVASQCVFLRKYGRCVPFPVRTPVNVIWNQLIKLCLETELICVDEICDCIIKKNDSGTKIILDKKSHNSSFIIKV